MSSPQARIVVWDEATTQQVEDVELSIKPVVSDGGDKIVFYLSQTEDVLVPQEWVGKKLFIEVAPSVVTGSGMLSEVERVARKLGMAVA